MNDDAEWLIRQCKTLEQRTAIQSRGMFGEYRQTLVNGRRLSEKNADHLLKFLKMEFRHSKLPYRDEAVLKKIIWKFVEDKHGKNNEAVEAATLEHFFN